jgi:hypothetical protein
MKCSVSVCGSYPILEVSVIRIEDVDRLNACNNCIDQITNRTVSSWFKTYRKKTRKYHRNQEGHQWVVINISCVRAEWVVLSDVKWRRWNVKKDVCSKVQRFESYDKPQATYRMLHSLSRGIPSANKKIDEQWSALGHWALWIHPAFMAISVCLSGGWRTSPRSAVLPHSLSDRFCFDASWSIRCRTRFERAMLTRCFRISWLPLDAFGLLLFNNCCQSQVKPNNSLSNWARTN